MKKVIFGITSLTVGGAEKTLIDIIEEIEKEYKITVFTLYGKGEFEKSLPKNIELKTLYKKSYNELSKLSKIVISLRLLLFRKQIYNKYIKNEYDTEIAFLEGPITRLFSVNNNKTKKIAWVHTDISKIFGNSIKSKLKTIINKDIYNNYDKIVLVSKNSLKKFKEINPQIEDEKLEIIHNYINKEKVIKKAEEDIKLPFKKDVVNIVCVGRLVDAKAYDRLIRIHARLVKDNIKHYIYVIGNGPLQNELKQQIEKEKVENTFYLLGEKENPYVYIKNADYFCLLSYFEGYPMVLEEAKILDKFIITNTAAKEVVENYEKSIVLENNEEAIYEGLKNVIENKEKYEEKDTIKKEYNNDDIIQKIKAIIG